VAQEAGRSEMMLGWAGRASFLSYFISTSSLNAEETK
jgi:hypothetical protein